MHLRFLRDHCISGLFLSALAFSSILLLTDSASGQYDCGPSCRRDLARVRKATAMFHRESLAWSYGYMPVGGCVESPVGGMGIHYLNPSLAGDTEVVVTQPELLLYEPTENERLRLVGVEYFVPVIVNGQPWFGSDPPPAPFNPAPELFGQTFDGPMEGHDPGMPWHYELHVWIWKNNPAGMFASFNPTVSCE